MEPRHRRLIVAPLLALHLVGCSRWELSTVSPATLIEREQPSAVRLTRQDGTQVKVGRPMVRGDSILTQCERSAIADGRVVCPGAPPPVPLADVDAVEVERTNVVGTLAVIAVAPVVLLFVSLGVCQLGTDPCGPGA